MGQDTVRLYTRQNDKTLLPLKRQGRIINQRIYVEMHFGDIAPLFLESYDWFTKEAARRVPKPEDVKAPIWCSISAENCLKPIDGTVVYVLEVPKEKVIYFDEAKWDYVLNRIYLPKDEQDAASYREHLKHLGISNGFEFFEGATRACIRRKNGVLWKAGSASLRSTTGRSLMCAAIYGRSRRRMFRRSFIRGKTWRG